MAVFHRLRIRKLSKGEKTMDMKYVVVVLAVLSLITGIAHALWGIEWVSSTLSLPLIMGISLQAIFGWLTVALSILVLIKYAPSMLK